MFYPEYKNVEVEANYSDLRHDKKDGNQLVTHGYVHGHVHQHKDHMHIHGHIHNHDHMLQSLDPPANSLNACKEFDVSACKEDSLSMCDDIYCEELDDCYYYQCDDDTSPQGPQCCDDPKCLSEVSSSICTDPVCTGNERHDNSLCDSQNSRMGIFENLIQNVSKNIEQQSAPLQSVTPEASDFHIHFPHHCHQEGHDYALSSAPTDSLKYETSMPMPSLETAHTMHHSCFHAKVPATTAESSFLSKPASDYDFLVQFNNLNQMGELETRHKTNACQWEQCLEPVNDSLLFDHVLKDHVKKNLGGMEPPETNNTALETSSSEQVSRFGCEWSNCDFVDSDWKSFLDHLSTHTLPEVRAGMLTPASMESASSYDIMPIPHNTVKDVKKEVNITQVRISPKQSAQQADADFSCKWQLGTNADGSPILCNKKHTDEGELQAHLQQDHIGHGKHSYQCCWYGCERNGGKEFAQRQKVYRHIHMHTGHKPCVCDECGLRFAVPAMLKQHQRMHSGERPYKCKLCDKAFSNSSALGIHIRTHSGVKPSQCTWPGCGRKFNERSNFHKHLKTHTKSYHCDVCGEECSSRKALTLHKKRAHLL